MNESFANSTGDADEASIHELNEIVRGHFIGVIVFLVIVMVFGIVGNALVLYIYTTKIKRSRARVYILSLAIVDLCVCIVGIPYHVLDLTFIFTYTHSSVCKILTYTIGTCSLASDFILLVVGFDRYMKVCRPLKKTIADFGDKRACIIAFLIACAINIPNGIIYGASTVYLDDYNMTGTECFLADEYIGNGLATGYLFFILLVFIASVIFLTIVYGLICRTICTMRQRGNSFSNSPSFNSSGRSHLSELSRTESLNSSCTASGAVSTTEINEIKGVTDTLLTKPCSKSLNDLSSKNAVNNHRGGHKPRKTFTLTNSMRMKTLSFGTLLRDMHPGSKHFDRTSRKITMIMLCVTIIYIITRLPYITVSLLDSLMEGFWYDLSEAELIAYDLLLRIYIINNVANPLVYGFWDDRFRRHLKRIFGRAVFVRVSDDDPSSESHS